MGRRVESWRRSAGATFYAHAMDLGTPMQLYRDQQLVALITSYSYDQPWASGRVDDLDPDRGARSERAAAYLQWFNTHEDLPEDDDAYDEVCAHEMARHGTTSADVDWCTGGTWTIRTRDGIDNRVYSLDFITDHRIQWRW
ncbi:hypothetical protein ACFXHA_13580 [Nocardia sp. NPDC059240]|uniref:hypothetical protein n=1 Tax=Nocardia sp. NPDC059240 TaxID=3346786 RepID=UPI0036B7FB6C